MKREIWKIFIFYFYFIFPSKPLVYSVTTDKKRKVAFGGKREKLLGFGPAQDSIPASVSNSLLQFDFIVRTIRSFGVDPGRSVHFS